MNSNLLIRADASPEIGTGHVMRCLALAEEWHDQGGDAVFAMAESTPAIRGKLAAKFEVIAVPGSPGEREDAAHTSTFARKRGSNWLVLDGYRLGQNYQQTVQESGCKILLIDDIAGASGYFADIILNQNIYASKEMYRNYLPSTRFLLGSRFVLLRSEFARRMSQRFEVREAGTRVLIVMGGSDPRNVSGRILKALDAVNLKGLEIVVVLGPANPHTETLRMLAASSMHTVRLVQDPKSLLDLMLWTDVALSAAGSTVWELCRVGVPSILLPFAANQLPGARELARKAITVNLGNAEEVSDAEIPRAVETLLLSYQTRSRMSELASALVDGMGCERVVAAMHAQGLKLRPATMRDGMILFNWVNDPAVREASFQSRRIAKDEHLAWFSEKLRCDHARIYIAEDAKGDPVGQFRVEWNGNGNALVDVSVAAEKRGLGIAERMIIEGIEVVSRDSGLRSFDAYIKAENAASLRAFKKAGFDKVGKLPESIHLRKEVARG